MGMVALFFSSSEMGARRGVVLGYSPPPSPEKGRKGQSDWRGAKRVPDGGKGELENPRESEEYSVTEEERDLPRNFCLLISDDRSAEFES